MKRLFFTLGILSSALTFMGAGYVLLNQGRVNAGYACVPMVFTAAFLAAYRKL